MEEMITIIIKDGNRAVNWEFPGETTMADVLARWRKDYYPFDPAHVMMNGKAIPQEAWGCFIRAFTEDGKIYLILWTKFPKQKENDE